MADENERRAKNMSALNMYYVAEEKEERFDTNLCEILNETNVVGESVVEAWNWTNIETMPWNYTEMVYPTATVHYENSEYDNTNLDYLMTSSFIAPNSGIGERGNDVRVKFVYDPTDSMGIYVNTIGEEVSIPEGDVNGDGVADSTDAQWILQMDAGRRAKPASGTPEFEAADVNEDGLIDSTDAQWILQYDAGRRPSL